MYALSTCAMNHRQHLDLVCIGFLVWVVTGIYMWWNLRTVRAWGTVALVAGVVGFVGLVLAW